MKKPLLILTTSFFATSLTFADITGVWKGQIDFGGSGVVMQGKPTSIKAPQQTLEIKADGSYLLSTTSVSDKKGVWRKGTWKRVGNEITLSPDTETLKKFPKVQAQRLNIEKGETSLVMKVQAKVGMGAKPGTDAKPVELKIVFKR